MRAVQFSSSIIYAVDHNPDFKWMDCLLITPLRFLRIWRQEDSSFSPLSFSPFSPFERDTPSQVCRLRFLCGKAFYRILAPNQHSFFSSWSCISWMTTKIFSLRTKQKHKTIKHIISHIKKSDCSEEKILCSFHDV